jgi:hypothetical protein
VTIPEHAWLDGNPLYNRHFKVVNSADRLRRDVARAFHDALPDAVAECLVDELMAAEEYGDQLKFLIKHQVDPAIHVVLEAVKKLAVSYTAANGEPCLMVPVSKLDHLLQ